MIFVSSPGFCFTGVEEMLTRASGHFDGWEIMCEGRHRLPDIKDELMELIPSYDLKLSAHAPMSDINIAAINPRMWDSSMRELLEGLEAAYRVGADTYTFHPGIISPLGSVRPDIAVKKAREGIERIASMSADTGVKVGLENMPSIPTMQGRTPKSLLELLEGFDIGITFDIGHAHTMGLENEFLDLLPRFVNLHIHDNKGNNDDHLTIGDGNVEFNKILRRLSSYSGKYVIECRCMDEAIISEQRLRKMLP